jgi:hypothetical protein
MSYRFTAILIFIFCVFLFKILSAQNIDAELGGNSDQVGFYIINSDGDTLFTCKANGRVGIGVKNPTNILEVVSPSGGDGLSVVNNSGNSRILLSIGGGDFGFMELHDDDGYTAYLRSAGISFSHGSEYSTIGEEGGFFQSNSSTGNAVHGVATATGSVTNHGGYFESAGSDGRGLYAEHTTSGNYGYIGSSMFGVYGRGTVHGVSGSGNAVGVYE